MLINLHSGSRLVFSAFAALTCALQPARAASVEPTPQHGSATHGTVGYIGIDVRDVNDDEVSSLKLKDAHGAEIIKVDHDGPAGKMGLRERDVIVQLNGAGVDDEEQVRRMLREMAPGRNVALVICRDGQQLTVTAQMADRSQLERQAWEQHLAQPAAAAAPQAPASALPGEDSSVASAGTPSGPAPTSRYSRSFLGTLLTSASYTGAMLELMGPQLAQFFGVQSGSGLLVRSVEDNSPAALAGLHAGDVVVRANALKVASMSDWARTIRDAKGRPVTVVVLRDRQEKTLLLTPDSKKRSEIELPGNPGNPDAPDQPNQPQPVRLARLTEL